MKILTFDKYLREAKNPCWSGYQQRGLKKKGNKTVPNCVPIKESDVSKSYTFDELSKEAQEKAIEKNREINTEGWDWWESVIDDFTKEKEDIGMTDIDCQFSGFYSQGDGASFTGKVSDNKKFLDSIGINPFVNIKDQSRKIWDIPVFSEFCNNIIISINRIDSRHSHQNTISGLVEIDGEIEMDLGIGEIIELDFQKLCDKIEPQITSWARSESIKLYNDLEKYYDQLSSDKEISSALKSSGFEFNANGEII